jgi:Asp-tRNA(Asn)/Glu-tRNA(Gln) amidotransferase A subunit family amidase
MALSWSMDKIGPMGRTVADCALVFQAIYGPDGLDTAVVNRPFPWPLAPDLRTLRIGYAPAAFEADRPGKVFDDETLALLRELGAQLVPIKLPDYPHESLLLILLAEAAAAFDELTRYDQDDLLTRQDDEAWPNVFRMARLIPAVEYLQANRIRTQLCTALQDTMSQVDLYLQPFVWGKDLALTNFTGHPAVIVPNGLAGNGRPTNSMVFVGRLYEEATLLAVAQGYQEQTQFHRNRPPLFNI